MNAAKQKADFYCQEVHSPENIKANNWILVKQHNNIDSGLDGKRKGMST